MSAINEEDRESLEHALRQGLVEQAEEASQRILQAGVDPFDIVHQVLVPTLTEVGSDFQDFKIFLPELMMAGEAAKRVTDLLEAFASAQGKAPASSGTIVIGQVEGDIHDIGRNIVRTILTSHGFKVIDLGHDVPASKFLEAAESSKADIVGLSALMTTTLPAQRRTISLFREVGKRDQFKIIVGGGATNSTWSNEIGADGYASDAVSAVDLCKSLL